MMLKMLRLVRVNCLPTEISQAEGKRNVTLQASINCFWEKNVCFPKCHRAMFSMETALSLVLATAVLV
jgi:hypothetical protein